MRKQRAVPKYPRPKPPSKVAVKRLLAVAHANDMTVSGIEADPDGSVSVLFGKASDANTVNPWDEVLSNAATKNGLPKHCCGIPTTTASGVSASARLDLRPT